MIGNLHPATGDHAEALERAIDTLNNMAAVAMARADELALGSAAHCYVKGRANGLRDAVSRITCLLREGH